MRKKWEKVRWNKSRKWLRAILFVENVRNNLNPGVLTFSRKIFPSGFLKKYCGGKNFTALFILLSIQMVLF